MLISYALFFFRDQQLIERLSKAMSTSLIWAPIGWSRDRCLLKAGLVTWPLLAEGRVRSRVSSSHVSPNRSRLYHSGWAIMIARSKLSGRNEQLHPPFFCPSWFVPSLRLATGSAGVTGTSGGHVTAQRLLVVERFAAVTNGYSNIPPLKF